MSDSKACAFLCCLNALSFPCASISKPAGSHYQPQLTDGETEAQRGKQLAPGLSGTVGSLIQGILVPSPGTLVTPKCLLVTQPWANQEAGVPLACWLGLVLSTGVAYVVWLETGF